MRRILAAALLAVGLAVGLGADIRSAQAHHAWNEIDTVKTMTLTGTVKSLKWENPHASLVLETGDGTAKVAWTVLMSGLARMAGRGVESGTVAVGRTLTIVASPARDEAHVVRATVIRDGDREYVLY